MNRLIKKGKSNMTIIYAGEEAPKSFKKSLYLAGPTPRIKTVESWRKEALEILNKLNYDGVVFVPESRDGETFPEYNHQFDWETKMMHMADCILFWIDRELRSDFEKIALTTNIEWGVWKDSGKVVLGYPKDAPKNRYISKQAEELKLDINYTLQDTIEVAIDMLGDGAFRENGECYVPLIVWSTKIFQDWYESQKNVGNELRYARVNYLFKMPKAKKVFLWVLHVHVYIKSEDRIKENEFVLSRTDICSVVMYRKGKTIEDTEVVLVREFRSPASNSEAMIYEIPGGSSINQEDNIDTIHDEIKEELAIDIDKSKLEYIQSRQLMGTLSSHKSHLYSIELTEDEINHLKNDKEVHGIEEDSERTYTEVKTIKEILSSDICDWSNIGMIMSVITK